MSQVQSTAGTGVRGWQIETVEPRQAPFRGGPVVRVVVGPAAGEQVGVLEVTLPAGGAMPEHDHGDSAVLLIPLAGHFRLVEAGQDGAAVELRPGSLATIPAGRRVGLENAGETEACTLAVLTPPDYAGRLEAWPSLPAAPDTDPEAETLATALEREHREIDEAIEAFLETSREGRGKTEPLTQAMQALRRHIFLEEQFLFPPLRDAGFIAPVLVMLREHGDLWRTMESIERELADDAAQAGATPHCKLLLAQLEQHNSKEEPILYPHADDVLGAPASAELKAFIRSGRMPDGWVCSSA